MYIVAGNLNTKFSQILMKGKSVSTQSYLMRQLTLASRAVADLPGGGGRVVTRKGNPPSQFCLLSPLLHFFVSPSRFFPLQSYRPMNIKVVVRSRLHAHMIATCSNEQYRSSLQSCSHDSDMQ